MPEIELVASQTDAAGRTYYEPIVATVKGYSEYNKEQFSLTTPAGYIKGYWQLTPKLKERMSIPPPGTKAEWYLSTKPKTGEKAKPGSVYCDVVDVRRVPEGHVEPLPTANEQPEGNARPAGAISDSDPVPPEWSLPREYWEKRQVLERRSIQMQTAFNGLVTLMTAFHRDDEPKVVRTGGAVDIYERLWAKDEVERMKYQVRTLVLMLVPGLPESEGAQQAQTDAEDLPWGDEDATPLPSRETPAKPPVTVPMNTGAEIKKASH